MHLSQELYSSLLCSCGVSTLLKKQSASFLAYQISKIEGKAAACPLLLIISTWFELGMEKFFCGKLSVMATGPCLGTEIVCSCFHKSPGIRSDIVLKFFP